MLNYQRVSGLKKHEETPKTVVYDAMLYDSIYIYMVYKLYIKMYVRLYKTIVCLGFINYGM